MSSANNIQIKVLEKEQLKHAVVFSGISPKAMRRVFAAWSLFSVIVAIIVVLAPGLSQTFQLTVFGILIAFTLAMFAQSRIAEGWPALIGADNEVCVVRDPPKREFICVPKSLVKTIEPTLIKPNKKALALILDTERLSEEDAKILNKAVWPRDDRLLALAHFISRDKACKKVSAFLALS
ncbi:hypothetical protein [Alteromonas sp. C1M14]|uniref:hypothetical protein n=1 Tax=Alteromonas sp. C1M14 TaxID=2841567 RepID=UPI001C08BA45|nr:hypothetical protein [Alteromonas sp. C1M14]MBU2977188.1 hypothetical protein [Alteromonas sp. C1M14]